MSGSQKPVPATPSNYEDECRKHIVHDAVLPKWNMLSNGRIMTNRTKLFFNHY